MPNEVIISGHETVTVVEEDTSVVTVTEPDTINVTTAPEPHPDLNSHDLMGLVTQTEFDDFKAWVEEQLGSEITPPPSGDIVGINLTKFGLVLRTGRADEWDEGLAESPVIWFDDDAQQYGMVYTGYNRTLASASIGLAWSTDLRNWTKHGVPILTPNTGLGEASLTAPYMIKKGATYYLFYARSASPGYEVGQYTMNVATSPSPSGPFTRYAGNPVIGPSIGQGNTHWRSGNIWHPNIVLIGDTYYMFFNASRASDGTEQIGYATSTNLLNWTVRDDHSPLLSPVSNTWEHNIVGDPSLYFISGTWYMKYFGWSGGFGGFHGRDGLAFTSATNFPLQWQKHVSNPILNHGTTPSFDDISAHKPFIVNLPGRHYHFYTAVQSATNRRYLDVRGTANSYAWADESVDFNPIGDTTYEICVWPDTLTPATNQTLAGRWNVVGGYQWWWFIRPDGKMEFRYTNLGTLADAKIVVAPDVIPGDNSAPIWLKMARDQDDPPTGESVYRFSYSHDPFTTPAASVSYAQIGGPVRLNNNLQMFSAQSDMEIGSVEGGTQNRLKGRVYVFGFLDAAGQRVARPDFRIQTWLDTQFNDNSAGTGPKVWNVGAGARIEPAEYRNIALATEPAL